MGYLLIELIPKTCKFSNVRTLLPKKQWDILRKKSYEDANHKCEICFESGKSQGYKHDVECHEIWEYIEETKTQKLVGLISLCPSCHQVIHFGRTSAIGKQAKAFKRLEIINKWTHKECLDHLALSMSEYLYRSQFKWKLDLSILEEEYGIDKKLITEGEIKRK